jgi:hypothetical protein
MAEDTAYPFDLGGYTRAGASQNAAAQTWFDRGLNQCFAFNHEEALRCFDATLQHDADCVLAHWGIAYAVANNYNRGFADKAPSELIGAATRARDALAAAAALCSSTTVSPVERALVDAMTARWAPAIDATPFVDNAGVDAAALATSLDAAAPAYAEKMRLAFAAHADDADVVMLFVESVMNLNAWSMWCVKTGAATDGAETLETQQCLEAALEKFPLHPGLLHFHIHLMELSHTPERALSSANTLFKVAGVSVGAI